MGLKSIHGTTLRDEWEKGAYTYLGTTIAGYPNLFSIYGPVSSTYHLSFCSGSNIPPSMAQRCYLMAPLALKCKAVG